jgi:hypothetical protein
LIWPYIKRRQNGKEENRKEDEEQNERKAETGESQLENELRSLLIYRGN